jgi:hypothetical protein
MKPIPHESFSFFGSYLTEPPTVRSTVGHGGRRPRGASLRMAPDDPHVRQPKWQLRTQCWGSYSPAAFGSWLRERLRGPTGAPGQPRRKFTALQATRNAMRAPWWQGFRRPIRGHARRQASRTKGWAGVRPVPQALTCRRLGLVSGARLLDPTAASLHSPRVPSTAGSCPEARWESWKPSRLLEVGAARNVGPDAYIES